MKHQTRSIVIVVFCFVLLLAQLARVTTTAFAADDFSELDSLISSAMKRHHIPGIALAITKGDQVVYSQGYGTAGNRQALTADTPFYIGSQSKSFTALAIMQLVEQGKLDLDAPLQKYIPWFRVADEQASGKITIRHLLQHTSGLSESGYVANFSPNTPLETLVRDLSRAKLSAPVGEKMQYFNPGYSTLGLLIETVSGKSYGGYLRENIFVPLKMEHSFTDPVEAKAAGLAQGYAQVFMLPVPADQVSYQYDLPAGFIISTANDMARYLMALNNGGTLDGAQILQPENVKLLFTPNAAIDSMYGFGWYISKYHGETKITHGGDTERFHTSVLLLPDQGFSLVMLFNQNHLFKDINEYNTIFWSAAALLTGHPMPEQSPSSIIFGWGLFAAWLVILVLMVRKVFLLPRWRQKMLAWNSRSRWMDILKHLFWIAFDILFVTVVGPALLQRGFSLKWFIASLPEVAIIITTLILDDALQVILKSGFMLKHRLPARSD